MLKWLDRSSATNIIFSRSVKLVVGLWSLVFRLWSSSPAHRLSPIILLCLLLAACSPLGSAVTPTPTLRPALLPITPGPTARPSNPAPTVEQVQQQGAALPDRLLFVKAGNVWLWQGENGRQLTSTNDSFQPAWSPDGRSIAYVQRGESYSDIMLMPLAGGEPQRLTNNGSNNPLHSFERIYDTVWAFYPAFSPDGAEIAFASQYGPAFGSPATDYHLALFSVPASTGSKRQMLYADDNGHVERLAFSPDGTAIVFAFGPSVQGATPRLYRYERESGAAEAIANLPEQSYDPSFSPDGHWLAFATRNETGVDIQLAPVAGGNPIQLTKVGSARAPAFSPDGRTLAFLAIAPGSRNFDLWVVDLQAGPDGQPHAGEPRRLTEDMGIDADSGVSWGK